MPSYITKSQDETEELGAKIAENYASSAKSVTFTLDGNLGAGKTAFARGFIRFLTGNRNLSVSSPTFVLLYTYKAKNGLEIRHMDLYRIKNAEEVYDLDIEHAFENCINLIEWSDLIESGLPANVIKVKFSAIGESERLIEVTQA